MDMETNVLTETDFHQWALDTAQAIREHRFDGVDWEQVAEEIESLAKSERRELKSHLAQLMYHLLKSELQPYRRGASWEITLSNQRKEISDLLLGQPSLKPCLRDGAFLESAYVRAQLLAAKEIEDALFWTNVPKNCPYTLEMLLPDL